jgi:hypothetical protein
MHYDIPKQIRHMRNAMIDDKEETFKRRIRSLNSTGEGYISIVEDDEKQHQKFKNQLDAKIRKGPQLLGKDDGKY